MELLVKLFLDFLFELGKGVMVAVLSHKIEELLRHFLFILKAQ